MGKLLVCTHLETFSAFHYMLYIFLSGYNSRTFQDIKFKFSGFLLFVEATNSVKFQKARYTGFKADIFRISSITTHYLMTLSIHVMQFHSTKIRKCSTFHSKLQNKIFIHTACTCIRKVSKHGCDVLIEKNLS